MICSRTLSCFESVFGEQGQDPTLLSSWLVRLDDVATASPAWAAWAPLQYARRAAALIEGAAWTASTAAKAKGRKSKRHKSQLPAEFGRAALGLSPSGPQPPCCAATRGSTRLRPRGDLVA